MACGIWMVIAIACFAKAVTCEDCPGSTVIIISPGHIPGVKILSTRAVMSLGQCASHCKASSECRALNFYSVPSSTAPLCELHGEAKTIKSGEKKNATFGLYHGKKICISKSIPDSCKDKAWSFEKLASYKPQDIKSASPAILHTSDNVPLKQCLWLCMNSTSCASVVVSKKNDPSKVSCQLITFNRHTVRAWWDYFKPDPGFDVYESNCYDNIERDMNSDKVDCTFALDQPQLKKIRFSKDKFAYDELRNNIHAEEDCQKICRSMQHATCRSYLFDVRKGACFLSHTRSGAAEAQSGASDHSEITQDDDAGSHMVPLDLDDCVQFDLTCSSRNMTVNAKTSRMFRGTFGILQSPDSKCNMHVDADRDFSLTLDYDNCGIKRDQSGFYTSVVTLKYGTPQLVTFRDRQLKLVCRVASHLDDIFVAAQLHVQEANSTGTTLDHGFLVVTPSQPTSIGVGNYALRILDSDFREVNKVEPGEEGYLEVAKIFTNHEEASLWKQSLTSVYVADVVVSDMRNGKEVNLYDSNGCPLRTDMAKPFELVDSNLGIWRSRIKFSAFKESSKIHITGLVKPCQPSCPVETKKCGQDEKLPDRPLSQFRFRRANIPNQLHANDTASTSKALGVKGEVILLNSVQKEEQSNTDEDDWNLKPMHFGKLLERHFGKSGNYGQTDIIDATDPSDSVYISQAKRSSSLVECFTESATCLITVLLAALQAVLMLLCLLISYFYWRECCVKRFRRHINNPASDVPIMVVQGGPS